MNVEVEKPIELTQAEITDVLGTKEKTRELRKAIIKELLKYPDGIAIPDLARNLDENRPKLDTNHLPIFERLGIIDHVVTTSEKGRKVVGIKLTDNLNVLPFLLMLGDVFQTEYGNKILDTYKTKIHNLISEHLKDFYYDDYFEVADSIFIVKRIVGYYSAKILDIDKLSDLMTIARMKELLRDVMTRKTLLGRMAPTDDDEKDYLISLKERWLQFIKFNVKRRIDNMEIADKIKVHDPDVVRDIYLQTVMTPLNEKTEQFFSEILDVCSQKIRSDIRGT